MIEVDEVKDPAGENDLAMDGQVDALVHVDKCPAKCVNSCFFKQRKKK